MKNVESLEEILDHLQDRVFKATYAGNDCYVKLSTGLQRNQFHRLQSIIYDITRIPLFAPTLIPKGENVIIHETEKLFELQQLGIHVPKVYSYSEHYLIIEDCGPDLPKLIRSEPEQTQYYLEMAIRELAKLHRKGQCHGGAQIRNFTLKDGQIYLIDFEEDIKPEFFEGIFLRDIILFLTSIIGCGIFNFSLSGLIIAYEQESRIQIRERLLHLAKWGRCLEVFTKKPFSRWCGKDLIAINYIFEQIRLLYISPSTWTLHLN
ncbi:MAG TPA: hypothetical protein DDW65_00760 [Firmicutes bacterium]|jgi:hypothetical protein|nr:hypothetical protein [Bacillota bacterium]